MLWFSPHSKSPTENIATQKVILLGSTIVYLL